MKSLSVRVGVILIGVAIFGYAEVWAEDWKLFSLGSDSTFWWYDSQGITYHPNKVIRVSVKIVKAEEIVEMVKSGTKFKLPELEKMTSEREYARDLLEIDCLGNTVNHIQKLHYDSKGVLKSGEVEHSPGISIAPKSVAETLYKIVCK